MAKHRSFRLEKFVKSADDQLLKDYFKKWDISVPDDLAFDGGEAFDKFWNSIDEIKRSDIDAQLHCINDIADSTRDYVQKAVKEFDIQTVEDESSESTALRVFLHSKDAFDLAFDQYLYVVYSETLRHHRFLKGDATLTEQVFENVKKDIEEYFVQNGKSQQCRIRKYDDDEKYFTLVARGDFMKTMMTFQDGDIRIRSFRPAKEDILIFDKKNKVLSVKVSGRSKEEKQKYLEIFSKRVMGIDEVDDSVFDHTVVNLDAIKNKTFNYAGNEHIESVKLVRIDSKQRAARVTVSSGDVGAIQDFYGLNRDTTEIVSVKLRFWVRRDGKKSKAYTVEIAPPETTKIPEKREKKIIEDYLYDQGVLLFK
jgi:hypothetical protein